MPDLSEILASPDVIKAVERLITRAAVDAGVSQTHAERIALGMGARLEEGEKIEPLVALAELVRVAALEEAANYIDVTDEHEEGPLRDAAENLRSLARDGE